ncbi:MAG TPA: urea ABC transporter substrate-binding protein [Leptolyngbyaceae cyanobacterium M33_DOE_097]|uniref:histidine kinase n=1 Tax=Oscillatoriales cyanobacterium SpSt-418 TaxID=2282169 RepID=A0A7C3PDT3_9CYAN|nr:urea ABC transporter substrate-binding protein [Leptolyngbyaceae cyanobacterium M33_DOE_097]
MNQPAYSEDATIKVGILHSLVGPWAIGEIALKDAELMAIAEINQTGGILGKLIEPIIEDGASEPAIFAEKVKKLVQQDQVAAIFGCWTSTVRRYILPILEELNTLLWYPVQYEGLECSKNIFYTGACPNQQVEPAVDWLLENKGNRFYLVGSDIVFSHTCHKIIKAKLRQVGGTVLGEEYIPIGVQSFEATVQRIRRSQPDVVFSTVNSDSNLGFYPQYKAAGICAEDIPILAVSVTEDEVRQIGVETMVGHYAAHNYFQSLETPLNQTFVHNFKTMYGNERVTCDPVEAAYVQVYLWKQSVEKARSFEVDQVRAAAYGQTLTTPGGVVRIEQNQHLWKTCRIGKIRPDGQFQIVFSNDALHKPQPWLGVDDVQFPTSELVIDMLAEAAQAIQYSCLLQQKSRELIEANQDLQALTHRVELLKRNLSSQIRRSLELDTILSTAVYEIRNLLEVDRCKFLWYEDNSLTKFKLSHEAIISEAPDHLSHYPIREIAELGEIVLQHQVFQINDVATLKPPHDKIREQLQAWGFTSLLTVSLRTHSGRQGVIICEHVSTVRPWSESEVELMQDVADQLAIAIDQSDLYEQARAAAHQAQTQAQQLQKTLHELQTTQAQLVQTEKMSSLGQLIAGIAHEINNPINFIYGNLQPASQYAEDLLSLVQLYQHHYPNPVSQIQTEVEDIDLEFLAEDLPKLLKSMKIGADRIRQIILSLRNFSRLDEAEMKPVDIHEGIDSTLLILHSRLKERSNHKGIEIIKDYGELPLIECYAGQLNQVFMNILSNAIDALDEYASDSIETKNRSPQIQVSTKMLSSNEVAIHITDNGAGIPLSVQERLFEPFFTTKPAGKGTGLGLAISHQIVVDKHHGKLKCISHVGQGTEFVIHIPAKLISNPSIHTN